MNQNQIIEQCHQLRLRPYEAGRLTFKPSAPFPSIDGCPIRLDDPA